MTAIGQMTGSAESVKSVMIHDPVAGVTYSLEPRSHAAHVSHNTTFNFTVNKDAVESMLKEKMSAEAMAKVKARVRGPEPNTKSEELGSQVMEGVSVQGKRVTRTIPAGDIGNDRALEIVTETWFSPELQVVVMSRTTDPRSGDSVYKLTNVSRAEPDRSLFEVPADYQIREEGRGGAGVNVMRRAPRPE